MFFAENEYGSDRLKNAFQALSIPEPSRLAKTAKFLDVSQRTLSSWLDGKSTPPKSAVYAVWHESSLGRAVTSAHSEHGAYLWRSMAKSQAEKITRLESTIAALTNELAEMKKTNQSSFSANDTFFLTG